MFLNNPAVDAAVELLNVATAHIKAKYPADIDWQIQQGAQKAFSHLNSTGAHITWEAVLGLYPRFRMAVPTQQQVLDAFDALGGNVNQPMALVKKLEIAGFESSGIPHAINAALAAGVLVQVENGSIRKA